MKILVIGCGSIGRRHIRLLREMGVEVEGFDTFTTDAAIDLRKSLDVAINVGRPGALQTLLGSTRFDGAIISTPNHIRVPILEQTVEHPLPLLVEKPLGHDATTAATMAVNMNRWGKPLLVGYCLRHHDHLKRIKQLVSEGALGTIRHASFHFGHDLRQWRPGTDYRTGYAAKRETGGGILLDASHELDLANWFLGEPRKVTAMVRNTGALEGLETEDLADALIEYASGERAAVHVDYLSPVYHRGCVITGDKGVVNWGLDTKNHLSRLLVAADGEPKLTTELHEPDAMYRTQLAHFLACIRGEEQPLVTGEDGIRALRLVEAARQSSDEGRTITL